MIDITIDPICREIRIEYDNYSLDDNNRMIKCLYDLIHKVKYSGESITLWNVINEKEKKLIHEF